MGCVLFISIVQFSRINPLFSGRRLFYQTFISLSSTFLFFSKSFLALIFRCSRQRKIVYHFRFRLSMFFFWNIRCKSLWYSIFSLLFRRDSYLLYTYPSNCQHLFSTFFIFLQKVIFFLLYAHKKADCFQSAHPFSSIWL